MVRKELMLVKKASAEKMVAYLVELQGPWVKGPTQKKFSYHTA